MSLGAFWRSLTGYKQPLGELVIDLQLEDRMDLAIALIMADDSIKAPFNLTGDNFVRIHSELMDHALKEHEKGRVAQDGVMTPVRLSEDDWKAVAAFCMTVQDQVKGKWPVHVLARIMAEVAKVYPKAGGPRQG